MSEYSIFTSESVSEGHPDKMCDAISDSMDMDWTSRDGAKAVVALLMRIGGKQ